MLTRTTKASSVILGQVADLVLENEAYLKEEFPQCSNPEELLAELKKSPEPWNALVTDRPGALFTLHVYDTNALLDRFFSAAGLSFDELVRILGQDLQRMKIESLTLRAPEELTEKLTKNGFEKRRLLVRLKGAVVETKLMPILPLNNPAERDIPVLSRLMYESYEKSSESKLPSVGSAEKLLRDIMNGSYGAYVAEASFTGGAIHNVVSACFVTLSSPREAKVTQLFTHPLYRARGLATIEVSTSMNKLVKRGVQTLTVWLGESNEVARRLFTKIGFKQDRKLVEMVTRIQ